MHIFYDSTLTPETQSFALSEEESKHACRVMRLKEGDEIGMVNGKGCSFIGRITVAHPKHCQVEIVSFEQKEQEKKSIHLAIAPTKNSERLEWFLEKATEIGVTEITLLICSNNERKQVKIERLEKIIIAAMKQSKRLYLPVLHPLTPLKEFVIAHPNGLIAHCYDGEKKSLSEVFKPANCPILIGPEGDFSREEVDITLQQGYQTITLGENRLRTETAGLYAVMQAQLTGNKPKISNS
jgi:16S rRNA (uracil1498-N3)-methyltransferase